MEPGWNVLPGEVMLRRDLHRRFGGSWQDGMTRSSTSPNLLLFTSAHASEKYGYKFDGWHPDGTFHYTGRGQVGDQVMASGNRVLRDHRSIGVAVRLFEAAGKYVTYVGEFAIANPDPYVQDEAPDRDGALRSVIVFRLVPIGDVRRNELMRAPAPPAVEPIPLENHDVETYAAQHPDLPAVVVKREAALVARYTRWLAARGRTAIRQRVRTPAGNSMYTDLYDQTARELVEAKASSSRSYVRTGIGQVLDYGRYVENSGLAILLPGAPDPDLTDLMHSVSIACIWEVRPGEFERSTPYADGDLS